MAASRRHRLLLSPRCRQQARCCSGVPSRALANGPVSSVGRSTGSNIVASVSARASARPQVKTMAIIIGRLFLWELSVQ